MVYNLEIQALKRNLERKFWSSKCRTFKVSASFLRERPRKTCNEATRSDLKESKVSKDLAKERDGWQYFIRNSPPMQAWKTHVKENMMVM